MERKSKSANDIKAKCLMLAIDRRMSEKRFDKLQEIQKKYLHNIAVYFDGGKFPMSPMFTQEQAKIKVPFEVYTGISNHFGK